MIVFSIKGVRVRIHASLLIMMAFTALISHAATLAAVILSMAAHEAGHAVAAKLSGTKISEIEFMPFGAAARIDDMHNLPVLKAVAVCLSGPLASAIVCAASFMIPGAFGVIMRRVNFALAAFNLIPALPLDGGRALSRILGCKLEANRSAWICITAGRVLAVIILIIAAIGCIATGRINITYMLCAMYILKSADREKIAAGGGALMGLLDRKEHMREEGAMPVKWLAAMENTRPEELLSRLSPASVNRVAVYNADMKLMGVIEEDMLLRASIGDNSATVGDMLA